jgi:succinate dehydrogenase / fumarate reductase cytochrome b subunit
MWFVRFLSSSIGKKWIMAVSGLLLLLFLFSHIAGNSTLYLGSAAFQQYAEQLHSHQLLLMIFRVGLVFLFLTHISTGLILFFQNRKARPTPYKAAVRIASGSLSSRTLKKTLSVAASTMPYTGALIFLFVIIHGTGFLLRSQDVALSRTVMVLFGNPFYGLLHVFFFMVLTVHLHHGIWSLLQSLGLLYPHFTGWVMVLTVIIPVFFLIVSGMIPLLLIYGLLS